MTTRHDDNRVHLVAVFDPRPPGEAVDLYQHYFQTHHAIWRVACRLLEMDVSFVRFTEVVEVADALASDPAQQPFVWFDKPPLPVRYHHAASERLWSRHIPSAPSPREFLDSWNIAHWFPRLQSAFVRQPATAILDEATIRSIAGDMAFHDEDVFENSSVVTALENTLRALEPLGGTKGSKEVLRPWFGWSPFWDLEGSAPWESRRIVSLRNLGPFLVQQQANWGLEVGGIALQYLPGQVDEIPSIRTYVLGGAPVWWSARNRHLHGDKLNDFRLWPRQEPPQLVRALVELVRSVSQSLQVSEFVLESVSTPETYVLDIRPYSAVFEAHPGAHAATTLCLAAYLKGLAQGDSPQQALRRLPRYEKIAEVLRNLGHAHRGHGPIHQGPAAPVLAAPPEAARGAG